MREVGKVCHVSPWCLSGGVSEQFLWKKKHLLEGQRREGCSQ